MIILHFKFVFVDNRSAYGRINIKILFSTCKFFWRKYSAISRTPNLGEIWPVLSLICCKNRSAYRRINTVIWLLEKFGVGSQVQMTVRLVHTQQSCFCIAYRINIWDVPRAKLQLYVSIWFVLQCSLIKMCPKKKERKNTNPDSIAVIRSTVRHGFLKQENCSINKLKTSVQPCPHYSRGIWKGKFHTENASNVFHPYYAGKI